MDTQGRIRAILDRCALFRPVSPERRERLVAIARLGHAGKGHAFFEQGEDCPGLFVVGSGLVRIFKTSPAGKEHVLHLPGPGDTFAEVAVIGRFPCPAHAEALEDTDYVLLPAPPFLQLIEADHALALELLAGLSGWVRRLVHLMEDIALRDAMGRIARHLLVSGEAQDGAVVLPMRHRHLASHLNVTPETLSRCLRRLTEGGLVMAEDERTVRILDPDGLHLVAEGAHPQI